MMALQSRRLINLNLLFSAVVLSLAACGGGGDADPTPTPAPAPTLAPVPVPGPNSEYKSTIFVLQVDLSPMSERFANFKGWMDAYKSVGINTITLVTWIPVDPSTSKIKTKYQTQPWSHPVVAGNAEYMATFTKIAKSNGMKVVWKPQFVLDDGTNNNVSEWALGTRFYPHGNTFDAEKFLSDVKTFWIEWAAVAKREDVELLVIGTEHGQYASKQFTSQWRDIISSVRKIYSGKLTYAENHFEPTPYAPNLEFWGDLDYIGIDNYIPTGNGGKNTTYTYAYEKLFNTSNLGTTEPIFSVPGVLCRLHKKYNKPVLFTEFGIQSVDGSMNSPPYTEGPVDMDEQELHFRVNFDIWMNYPWIIGTTIWNNENESTISPSHPDFKKVFAQYNTTSYEFYSKPAQNVLIEYWKNNKAPPPISDKVKPACEN